jgi:predicted lysophospholipase L1 biosynthesis ABC-type transport system permease subunit
VVGTANEPLRLLLFAVLALLAIGCVNIAGLLLARGVKREREIAVRSAVGASRARILRQVFAEALLLAILGATGGVLLAYALLNLIRTLLIAAMSRGADVTIDTTVLLAALAVSVITSLLAAVIPALRLSGTAPNLALKNGGNTGSSRGQHRLPTRRPQFPHGRHHRASHERRHAGEGSADGQSCQHEDSAVL